MADKKMWQPESYAPGGKVNLSAEVYELLYQRKRNFDSLRGGDDLTLPAVIHLLVLHGEMDPEKVKDFVPLRKRGRPRKYRDKL